jgi:hypothetical protein
MEARPTMRKIVLAGVLAAAAALATTGPAYADGCSNAPSSIQQYVECTPSATGSHASGTGKGNRTVPKSIETKIDSQGGQDATLLHNIVSKESYGAPKTKIKVKAKAKTHKAKKEVAKKKIISDSATRQSNPLAASVGVITDGSDGRLIALIVLMLGVAAVVVVSALRKRRVTR